MHTHINLYEYQREALNRISIKLEQDGRVLTVMPTGSGKTYTFWAFVNRFLIKNPYAKILFLFNRTELLRQALATGHLFGIHVDVIMQRANFADIYFDLSPDNMKKTHFFSTFFQSNCILGMVESTIKAKQKGKIDNEFDLIVIDEAHIGNFRKVKEFFPDTKILGFTATPVSASKKQPLKDDYNSMIDVVSNRELVELGKLIEPIHITGKFAIDFSKMKRKADGEFDEGEQILKFSMPEVEKAFLTQYEKYSKDRWSLVFCVNINDCEETGKKLGIPFFHSKNSADHKQILADFRSGKIKSIATIGILATGFDFPPISAIFLKRVTSSLPLYLQMIGRGTRICEGKKDAIVVDILNNLSQFGEWGDNRDWKALFEDADYNPKVAPSKSCQNCGAANRTTATECKFCGEPFPKSKKDEVNVEFLGVEIHKKIDFQSCSIQELYEWVEKHEKGNSAEAAEKIFKRCNGDYEKFYTELVEFGKISPKINSPAGWAHIQIKLRQNGGKI